jgi:hypothetical protein
MGNFITIENINDPHDQKFLRAHDMPVSVLAVSPSGELLASGQIGTTRFKGNAAPVFVWSTVTGRRLTALRGPFALLSPCELTHRRHHSASESFAILNRRKVPLWLWRCLSCLAPPRSSRSIGLPPVCLGASHG